MTFQNLKYLQTRLICNSQYVVIKFVFFQEIICNIVVANCYSNHVNIEQNNVIIVFIIKILSMIFNFRFFFIIEKFNENIIVVI